jgi:hypothetical protein
MVPLARIPTDQGAQMRVKVRAGVVADYAAAMKVQIGEGGLRFPAVVLFSDGQEQWLADGFHRVLAARKVGLTEISAEVRPGTQRDAVLFGIWINGVHGLQWTRADKRKAVGVLLADPEWSQWNDREIARRCHVGNSMVSRMRRRLSVSETSETQITGRKVRRGDSVYVMKGAPDTVNGEAASAESVPGRPGNEATDALGIPLPEARTKVFAALGDFEEATGLFDRLAEVIDRIAQGPGGELYRLALMGNASDGVMRYFCPRLRMCRNELVAAEPYCSYCPNCHRANPERPDPRCKACGGRGWTTRTAFERCPESDRQRFLAMRTAPNANAADSGR